MHSHISSSKTYSNTHTQLGITEWRRTNQTNQKVKAMSMGPLQNVVTWYKNTFLDSKQSSGSLKRKDISFLNDISFFSYRSASFAIQQSVFLYHATVFCIRKGPSVMLKQVGEFRRHFSLHEGFASKLKLRALSKTHNWTAGPVIWK